MRSCIISQFSSCRVVHIQLGWFLPVLTAGFVWQREPESPGHGWILQQGAQHWRLCLFFSLRTPCGSSSDLSSRYILRTESLQTMAQRARGMCVFIREPGKNLGTRIQVEFRPSAHSIQYLTVAPLLCARVLLKYLPFFLADKSCQKQCYLVQHPLEYIALGAVGLLPTFVYNRSCNKTSKEVLCWVGSWGLFGACFESLCADLPCTGNVSDSYIMTFSLQT